MKKKTLKFAASFLAFMGSVFADAPAGYEVQTIDLPDVKQFNVAGLDVHEDGTVYFATREGEIWKRSNDKWSRYAQGLHEPCGLKVVDHQNIIVSQKPELTKVIDRNGDGIGDRYENVTDDFGFFGNYHEFHYGPIMDEEGNLFATLNLQTDGFRYQDKALGSDGGYRGWLYQVKADGSFEPYAYGLRSPAGIGWGPENTIITTDNQGGWMGSSRVNVIQKGKFYGAPVSHRDLEGWTTEKVDSLTPEEYEKRSEDPACWVPHIEVSNSPGNPVVDGTKGAFGPFAGQVFIGDQSNSSVFRVMLEEVNGEWQGAITNFLTGLQCGAIRIDFAPDGSMWVGQTSRGWASKGGKPFGVQRITFDKNAKPFEMHTVKITPTGFKIRFTEPVDKNSLKDINGQGYWFTYSSSYGSKKIRQQDCTKSPYRLSDDGLTLEIDTKLGKRLMYEYDLGKIKSTSGQEMVNNKFWYTVKEIPTNKNLASKK